jgi:rubrerythrin
MPKFENPFSGMKADRKLTKEETIRAIRFAIAAEYEAIQLYMQLAESISNDKAKKTLKSISDEEVVHVGELQGLLLEIAPEEKELYKKGVKEYKKLVVRK